MRGKGAWGVGIKRGEIAGMKGGERKSTIVVTRRKGKNEVPESVESSKNIAGVREKKESSSSR